MSQQEKPALRDIGGIVTLNSIVNLAPVVRRSDKTIPWINLYPVKSAIRFAITYPLDSVIRPLYISALVFPQSFQSCCEYSYIKLN